MGTISSDPPLTPAERAELRRLLDNPAPGDTVEFITTICDALPRLLDAADENERLREELDALSVVAMGRPRALSPHDLKAMLRERIDAQGEVAHLRERLAKAVGALKPLAKWIEKMPGGKNLSDGNGGLCSYQADDGEWVQSPTVGDCRRAAAVVAECEGEGK